MPEAPPLTGETWAVHLYKQDFRFDAGHFLIFADGTREPLHGHNYQVRVRLEGDIAPGDVVIDFLVAKPIVRELCDDWDHVTLVPTGSPHVQVGQEGDDVHVIACGDRFVLSAADVRLLPLPNTSVEMLAGAFAARLAERLRAHPAGATLRALEVEIEETPGQSASYRRVR